GARSSAPSSPGSAGGSSPTSREARQVFSVLFAVLIAQAHPLTLDEAVRLGLDRNTDLRRQVLLSLSAEQDKVLARAAVLPKLDFNASAGGYRVNGAQLV